MSTHDIAPSMTSSPSLAPDAQIPRSSPGLASHGSELLVVGDADCAEGVCTALRRVSDMVYQVSSVQRALQRGARWVKAHILVSTIDVA